MPKYKSGSFFQVSRVPFQSDGIPADINTLSLAAFKLYIWLNELEHRYTAPKPTKKKDKRQTDWFFRSLADLSSDTALSERAITNAKRELKEWGFIQTWQMHWVDPETQKKSYKHVTAFRILK